MPKSSHPEYVDEYGNIDGSHPQANEFMKKQEKKREKEEAEAEKKQYEKATGDYPVPDEETLEKNYSSTAPYEVSNSMYKEVFRYLKESNALFNIMRLHAENGTTFYFRHGSGHHAKIERYKTETNSKILAEDYQAQFHAAFTKICNDYGLSNENETQRDKNQSEFQQSVKRKLTGWVHKEAEAEWFFSMAKHWAREAEHLKKEFRKAYGLPEDFSTHK